MNNEAVKTENKKKLKLNALDIFIILAVVLCIAGVGIRYYVSYGGEIPGQSTVYETYLVNFSVSNIRETSADYFVPGDTFYITQTGDKLGVLTDTVSTTPSEIPIEMANGEYSLAYAVDNEELGRGRIDVTGTLLVEGKMTEDGFLVGGNTYIAPNKSLSVQSTNIYVNIIVKDITKAS